MFVIKKGEQKSEIAPMPEGKCLIITVLSSQKEVIHLYLERAEDTYGFLEKQFTDGARYIVQHMKNGKTRYSQYFFSYNNTHGMKDIEIKVELI